MKELLDIKAAVRGALEKRTDLVQARRQLESNDITIRYLKNQQLPQLDLTASYSAQGLGGTGEAEAIQCRVEQFTGDVAGERATGTVGALFARAEADHQQFGIQRSEGRNRQRVPVWITTPNAGQVFG